MILATPKPLCVQNTTRHIEICVKQLSYEFKCIGHSSWQAKCESISNNVVNGKTLSIWRARCCLGSPRPPISELGNLFGTSPMPRAPGGRSGRNYPHLREEMAYSVYNTTICTTNCTLLQNPRRLRARNDSPLGLMRIFTPSPTLLADEIETAC
jgi:hypothetical protein